MTWLTIIEYLCHKWLRIYSTYRKHFSLLSSFMTYHRVCRYINTTDTTSGAGTADPSGAPEFTPGFYWGSRNSSFNFMCMFCRSLFVLLYFFYWPLCCLFFFDLRILIAPFGVFKLFLSDMLIVKRLETLQRDHKHNTEQTIIFTLPVVVTISSILSVPVKYNPNLHVAVKYSPTLPVAVKYSSNLDVAVTSGSYLRISKLLSVQMKLHLIYDHHDSLVNQSFIIFPIHPLFALSQEKFKDICINGTIRSRKSKMDIQCNG